MTEMKSPSEAIEFDKEVPTPQLHVFHEVPKEKEDCVKM